MTISPDPAVRSPHADFQVPSGNAAGRDEASLIAQLRQQIVDLRRERDEMAARWEAVTLNAPQYITLIDRSLRVIYINRLARGWTGERVLEHAAGDLVPEESRDNWVKVLQTVFETQRPVATDLLGYSSLGTKTWYQVIVCPVRSGQDGQTEYLTVLAEDQTQQREMLQALETRQIELAHVSRLSTLGAMAAEMAHELNQPLSAIANFARGCQIRQKQGKLQSEDLSAALSEITSQAERAGSIIRSTRDFLRKHDRQRSRVSLNKLVEEILPVARLQADRIGIEIQLDLAADLSELLIDEVQIEQVILNLLLNAIEAMNQTPAAHRTISIRTCANGPYDVQLSVVDQGRGLTREISDHLFEAFFTTKPEGLGMGLSISRTIIENHGGRIWASPNYSRGATVAFILPVP